MTIRKLILVIFIVMTLFSIGLAVLVFSIYSNQHKLMGSYDDRYYSYLLADQLRQSSDDLTRFARTYAITGDTRFKQYYYDILGIRNGEQPRPEDYQRIYWDFLIANGRKPRQDGATVSLDVLLEQAGFTDAELNKLYKAEEVSNQLVDTEVRAFNAIDGLFLDETGKYTIKGAPDPMLASRILNDQTYHQEKARVGRPLDEFFVLLEKRTQFAVKAYAERSDSMLSLLKAMAVALMLLTLLLSWLLVRIVLRPLGGEPATMHQVANAISDGRLDIAFDDSAESGSVYQALHRMMLRLRETNQVNQQHAWQQQGMVSIGDALRQEQALDTMAFSTLQVLSHYVGAAVGVLYCWRDDLLGGDHGVLRQEASFSLYSGTEKNTEFALGEGIIGQAAIEDRVYVMNDIPEGYMQLVSGSSRGTPKTIIIVPFSFHGQLRGVVELCFLSAPPEGCIALLESLREPLGIAFENVMTRINLSVALTESQTMSEELQTQQEELRVMNDSLRIKSLDLEEQKAALELSQNEIQQKATELEQASRYKSEFLANMSHELRTPLNSLLILARSLADNDKGNLSPDEVESAEVIQNSGKHLLNLINDVLDLSKVEAGKMQVTEEVVDIQRLMTSLKQRFLPLAREKRIAFNITQDEAVPPQFISDYTRLEQILTNLIGNAIKFTLKGEVSVNFSRSENNQGGWLHAAVSDTGIGVSPSQYENIFAAFKQADGSTTREFGGTGLGLSISRDLAVLLGGTISLESELNQGSTFTLTFPEKCPNKAAARSLPKPEMPVFEESGAEKPTYDDRDELDDKLPLFLIIEDDPKFARILYRTCREQGAQAIIAENGEVGTKLAHQYKVTGIVLDYMLPGWDGDEVVNQLQSHEHTRDIPIHIMSALDNISDMRPRGVKSQLVKPVSKQQIVDVIHQVFDETEKKHAAKILIVEDDAAGSLALQHLLRHENVTLDFVHTGQDALQAVSCNKYVAVILDLGLPDLNGFEVLRELYELPCETLPPVIVHTGKELSDAEYLELSSYTDKIIIKSARAPEHLLNEVRQFFANTTLGAVGVNSAQSEQVTVPIEPVIKAVSFTDGETVASIASTNSLEGVDLDGCVVLLIDDDMRTAFALTKVLRNQKATVHVASSQANVLNLLQHCSDVDLVLINIAISDMDFDEVLASIQALNKHSRPRVIALTSEENQVCMAGIDDSIAKPINVEKLMYKIQQLL